MAKYYSTEHVHPFPWDQVAMAIFQRYPNPFSSHVLSEDTLYRRMLGPYTLYSRRFLTKTNKIPAWGEKFIVGIRKFVPLVEESVVDRRNKIITTYTRNVGLSRFMSAVEKISYTESPDNPNETIAVKEAWIESSLYGLRSAVKSFGMERFKKNCLRATEGFNAKLSVLQSQQHLLREMRHRKWQEVKESARYAAVVAKAHTIVHASTGEGAES